MDKSKYNLMLVSIVGIVAIIDLFLISTTNHLQTNTDLTGQAYKSNEAWIPPCDEEQSEFDVVLENFGAKKILNQANLADE